MRISLLSLGLAVSGCMPTAERKDPVDSASPDVVTDGDGDGWSSPEDCDDEDPEVHPEADEYCDALDSNCDGDPEADAIDADWHRADFDADGCADYDGELLSLCPGTPGYIEVDTDGGCVDCDDTDPSINRYATEVCGNGIDEDCTGVADDTFTWYDDQDGDGFGNASAATSVCGEAPAGTVADATDCDDGNAAINPDAVEDWDNGVDDDCDGAEGVEGAHDATGAERIEGWTGAGVGTGQSLAMLRDSDGTGTSLVATGADGAVLFCPIPLVDALDEAATILEGTGVGGHLASGGDGNGNGIDELLVPTTDGLWVVESARSGDAAISSVAQWVGVSGDPGIVRAHGGSDLDGDGLDDVVVARVTDWTSGGGEDRTLNYEYYTSILSGPVAEHASIEDGVVIDGGVSDASGDDGHLFAVLPGDLDADGYGDLAIDNGDAQYVFAGPIATGTDFGHAVAELTGAGGGLASPGDLDADGRADLVNWSDTGVYVFTGPLAGTWTTASAWSSVGNVEGITVAVRTSGGSILWDVETPVTSRVDADGDGVSELYAVTSAFAADRHGMLGRVVPSPGSTTTWTAAGAWYGTVDMTGFGAAALAADVDDDGAPELLIGAPEDGDHGALYLAELP